MIKDKRIAFVSISDANDINSFSGIPFNIYNSLKKEVNDLVLISPIKVRDIILLKTVLTIIFRITKIIKRKECINYYNAFIKDRRISKELEKRLLKEKIDLIIATSIDPFVYYTLPIPYIIITGGTVNLLYKDYALGKGWTNSYKNWKNNRSLKVTKAASKVICASHYCMNSLIADYGIPSNKLSVIPYGANIVVKNNNFKPKELNLNAPIIFLFVGKSWIRKGGPIAVEFCDCLLNKGLIIKLIIVGTLCPKEYYRDYIINYSFLDKNIPDEKYELEKCYKEAHFFILPTQAEFFGIVFSEAYSSGLPIITTDVGPLKEIVEDENTGFIMPKNPVLSEFVYKIYKLINNPIQYIQMSQEARNKYENIYNWESYCRKLIQLIKNESKAHK